METVTFTFITKEFPNFAIEVPADKRLARYVYLIVKNLVGRLQPIIDLTEKPYLKILMHVDQLYLFHETQKELSTLPTVFATTTERDFKNVIAVEIGSELAYPQSHPDPTRVTQN